MITEPGAIFSPCRTWRYTLTRVWDPGKPLVQFIGLNPSTADEVKNDPTVTRCICFASAWSYGGLIMTNIFGLRSTNPKALYSHEEPIGEHNDYWLKMSALYSGLTVAAWGNHGLLHNRSESVTKDISRFLADRERIMKCLGKTKQGMPKHPLYLRRDTALLPYP